MKNQPKIKLSQVAVLLQAFAGLDGRMQVVKGANGVETTVFQAFEFGRQITWNIVKNIGLLTRKGDDLEAMRNKLRVKHGAVGEGEVPKANREAFFVDYNAQMALEEELAGALTFKAEDLNLFDPKDNPNGNKIPGTVLVALSPFIA